MIKQFILLLAPFLLVGCGNADNKPDLSNTAPEKDPLEEAVDWAKLQNRNGDAYLPNTDVPYSGWAKRTFESEQVEVLAYFTDGTVTDLKLWQENGIIRFEGKLVKGKVSPSFEFNNLYDFNPSNNRLLSGKINLWHPNGEKKAEYIINDGLLNGKILTWHDNGQMHLTVNFTDGALDGSSTAWYDNGQKMEEGNYSKGATVGKWIAWHENGQKSSEQDFKEGKLHGSFKKWYIDGQKQSFLNFRKGKLDGLVLNWNQDGLLEENATYNNGEIVNGFVSTRYPNGNEKSLTYYLNGNKHGPVLRMRQDGQVEENATYHDNYISSGVVAEFNDDGQKINERKFNNESGELIEKKWDKDGKKISEAEYKHGEKHGRVRRWDSDGSVLENATYIDGQIVDGSIIELYDDYIISDRRKSLVNYKNGKIDGQVMRWRKNKELTEDSIYKEGVLVEGKKIKYNYRDYGREDHSFFKEKVETNYKNEKKHGIETTFTDRADDWYKIKEIHYEHGEGILEKVFELYTGDLSYERKY